MADIAAIEKVPGAYTKGDIRCKSYGKSMMPWVYQFLGPQLMLAGARCNLNQRGRVCSTSSGDGLR